MARSSAASMPAAMMSATTVELRRCMHIVVDRTLELQRPGSSAAKTAVTADAACVPAATPHVRTAEPKRCTGEAIDIDRTLELHEGSAAKAAVRQQHPQLDAARTPATTPCVTTAEPKQCVRRAIQGAPKLPEGGAHHGSHGSSSAHS